MVSSVSTTIHPAQEIKGEEDPKTRLLDETLQLLFRHGYRGLSMDGLARRLGMSKKTLYRYFPGKEALVAAAIARRQQHIETTYDAICATERDPVKRFCLIVEEVARTLSAVTPQFLESLAREAPALWRQVTQFREQRIRRFLRDLLDDGVRTGQVRDDVDADLTIAVCLAAVQSIVVPEVLMNSPFSAGEAVQGIMEVLLHGIVTSKRRPAGKGRRRTKS